MTIKKFQGKTKEEAMEKAKEEFGENAVIMNIKELKSKGIMGAFKKSSFEVTAAIEDREKFPEKFSNPISKEQPLQKGTDNINLAADEKITIPVQTQSKREEYAPVKTERAVEKEMPSVRNSDDIEKRLENLSNILEKKLSEDEVKIREVQAASNQNLEGFKFMKMLYRTLLDNDVNEKYVNQIMDEAEKVTHSGSSVDYILSNVYQKLILKFGQPNGIEMEGKKPRVLFFIGPTGVGKTTTIAKIASKYKVEYEKKVAFLTADTYRIAATEHLKTYANILDAPMNVVYSAEELNRAVENINNYDLIFVDTAGFSHKNETQRIDIKNLILGLDEQYEKEVYLVLSATTKYKDLLEIVDSYAEIASYKLVFTKLDETTSYGNILNIRLYSGADLSYMTSGQNVPDDIEVFNSQMIVKQLLGGR